MIGLECTKPQYEKRRDPNFIYRKQLWDSWVVDIAQNTTYARVLLNYSNVEWFAPWQKDSEHESHPQHSDSCNHRPGKYINIWKLKLLKHEKKSVSTNLAIIEMVACSVQHINRTRLTLSHAQAYRTIWVDRKLCNLRFRQLVQNNVNLRQLLCSFRWTIGIVLDNISLAIWIWIRQWLR